MKKPYLVQRCTISKPLNSYKNLKLSEAIDFDYMGSSEFEWGAIPKAFKELKAVHNSLKVVKHPTIVNSEQQSLYVLSALSEDELALYFGYLEELRGDKIRLKEYSRFQSDARPSRTDFWWDILNGVMWSFDKVFMKSRLINHLEESFKIIEQK